MVKQEQGLEEVKNQQQTMTSKEELLASINTMAKDYEYHAKEVLSGLKSLNKKSLLRILKDVVKYPMEENKDFYGEEEVRIASKLRAILDIKVRTTMNAVMIDGLKIKEKGNE